MKTSKDYKDLILEQLDLLDNINCRAMMGEYARTNTLWKCESYVFSW